MDAQSREIVKTVYSYIERHQMIAPGDCVTAGVSGGADSVCMLHILADYRQKVDFKLTAVYVNHGLRAEAAEEAAFVEALCRNLDVPFCEKNVNVRALCESDGLSVEEAARMLRYQALAEVSGAESEFVHANNADADDANASSAESRHAKIAVAHTQNDRAETMLFQLFRGTGLSGLVGIRPVREKMIRPILCLHRQQVESYLNAIGQPYCTDISNESDDYARNKIRHHILPAAEEVNAGVIAHMNRTAEIARSTMDFVAHETENAFARCVQDAEAGLCVDIAALQKEEPLLQQTVLLRCLEKLFPHRKDISASHVEALLSIMQAGGHKELDLPNGMHAEKTYGQLLLSSETSRPAETVSSEACLLLPQNQDSSITMPGVGTLTLSYLNAEDAFRATGGTIPKKRYTKWFDCDKITEVLAFRTRRTGDYLTVDADFSKQSVKAYMINEKIDKNIRNNIYMLADGAHILWIPGYRISEYYKVGENTRRILQAVWKGENDGRACGDAADGGRD